MSADHTFNRGIVHSLSSGQTGRQKAAQAENYRSKPLTRDTSILHRNHYVHHSCVLLPLLPRLLVAKYKKKTKRRARGLLIKKRKENANDAFFFLFPHFSSSELRTEMVLRIVSQVCFDGCRAHCAGKCTLQWLAHHLVRKCDVKWEQT